MARSPLKGERGCALALVLLAALPARAQQTDSCIECHTEQDPPLSTPVKLLAGDVHGEAHLSCADCHGGDRSLEDVKAHRSEGYVGRPKALEVATMCGRCHSDIEKMRGFDPRLPTDQQAKYLTSQHGKLAAQGDLNAATCVSCHGAHGIKRPSDPDSKVSPLHVVETCSGCHADPVRMKPYGIPTNQLEAYEKSVHGHARLVERDTGAPACNTCHGSHGLVPAGLASVFDACGKCHETQAELFAASTHAKAFAEKHARKEIASPSCSACHAAHEIQRPSDAALGGPLCASCHAPGDKCDRAANAMKGALEELGSDIAAAEAELGLAESLGMEVAEGHVQLAAAREALVRSRVVVHAFAKARLDASVEEGRKATRAVMKASEAALAEHRTRRRGLAVASLCLLAFATLLALKARRIAKESAPI
ncbi:MAG TPA: cytochrome c3 family protein [Planctomycetota bacterium]|nr:cytochrome c3 family protein [Planctomycetota bacterium]